MLVQQVGVAQQAERLAFRGPAADVRQDLFAIEEQAIAVATQSVLLFRGGHQVTPHAGHAGRQLVLGIE